MRTQPSKGAIRHTTTRQGAGVALVRHGTKTFAYVADEDSHAIHTFDVEERKPVARTRLSGAPAQVVVLADGRVAATIRNKNRVEILEPGAEPDEALTSLCSREVATEPIGIALSPDEKTILVTSGWGAALTALDTDSLATQYRVDVPREPRAVLVEASGERAFVSHAVGDKLTVLELKSRDREVRSIALGAKAVSPSASSAEKPRTGSQGYALTSSADVVEGKGIGRFAPAPPEGPRPLDLKAPAAAPAKLTPQGRIFAPMITVDPGDPNVASQAYYGGSRNGVPKEAPIVAVIDTEAERSLTKSVVSLGQTIQQECLLPRAAVARDNGTMLVTCLGIDALVELDTRGADPARLQRRRWTMPNGPTGLAVEEGRAVVWSQFSGMVSVIDLDADHLLTAQASVWYDPLPEVQKIARGRTLFHKTDDTRIANDGVACASCHPDGRDDALTWSTPEGPRQTIMLAGRAPNTAPYGWQGKHGDLPTYLGNTFSRLGGTGIVGDELKDLVAYLETMAAPPRSSIDQRAIDEGRELFADTGLGCASCHLDGVGVDRVTHDVGSRAVADSTPAFDTPSLLFVGGTGPYFHDGRYKTLEDLLGASDSTMGHTLHLSAEQRVKLAKYLRSL
jgi:hypothetical protein